MIRQRTSVTQPNIMLFATLSLFAVLAIELTDLRAAHAAEGSPQTIVSQPGGAVGLAIDLAGFTIDRDQIKEDGHRYLLASHPATGMNVSIAIEELPGLASATGCVEQLRRLQKGPAVRRGQDIALTTARDMHTLEYTLHRFRGLRLDQKSIYACIAAQNVYANIHLSKLQYSAADDSLFQSLLKTIRMQPIQPSAMTAAPSTIPANRQPFKIEPVRYRQAGHVTAIVP